jgi:N-acetylglucosamine-6-sulfatase
MLGSSFPTINGSTPMPKTKALMQDLGTMANQFFIHTPICCPSRSELLSGRYLHNIKRTCGAGGAKKKNCGCMHVDEIKVNGATFAKYLKEDAGYTVGMFGKYLNNMPTKDTVGNGSQVSKGTYVPAGFDAWLGNGGGNYIAPAFNTQNISFGGYDLPDGLWHGTKDNYSTSVIGNISIAWIKHVVAEDPSRPFFAYIAPKAAHEPFNPAPWYRTAWDASWPQTEPQDNPAWNCSASSRSDHHGNIATENLISSQASIVITDIFKNRWRTLMSVDDVCTSSPVLRMHQ